MCEFFQEVNFSRLIGVKSHDFSRSGLNIPSSVNFIEKIGHNDKSLYKDVGDHPEQKISRV